MFDSIILGLTLENRELELHGCSFAVVAGCDGFTGTLESYSGCSLYDDYASLPTETVIG